MAQPFLRRLLSQRPDARITALAPPHVAPILECMPEVHHVVAAPLLHGQLQWRERWLLAKNFQHFDRAYVLPNSLKSALIPWFARIPLRIGYLGEGRFGLLNRRLPNPTKNRAKATTRHSMAEFYAALAGGDPKGDYIDSERPRLQVSPKIANEVREKFCLDANVPYIGFFPGAEYGPAKRYPSQHFAKLAWLITKHWPQARILCLGGPQDRAISENIVVKSQVAITNLCGQTSLTEAVGIIKHLVAAVTNDSGLMHVAAALDVPMVAIYGSTDPQHTPPYSPLASVVKMDIPCSPCFQRECPLEHFRCMRELYPEQVFSTLETWLETQMTLRHA